MTSSVLILIVEDEPEIQLVLQASFEDGGFEVFMASNEEEAFAALNAKGNTVHALLTDIRLGRNSTGWDVAKYGRQLNPDLPVVYMTGGDGDGWASLGVPNSVLVTKPFAPAQVLIAVSQLLNVGNTPVA